MPEIALGEFADLVLPELHDRTIAADALTRGLTMITIDPEIRSVAGLKTVWA